MRTLVAYDSLFGNTEKLAQAIAQTLNTQAKSVKDLKTEDFAGLDLLVFGSPTHGGRPSQPTQDFIKTLANNSLSNIRTVTFDTSIPVEGQSRFTRFILRFFGYAAKVLAGMLKQKGAKIIGSESFFVTGKEGPLVDGEIERAKQWAIKLG